MSLEQYSDRQGALLSGPGQLPTDNSPVEVLAVDSTVWPPVILAHIAIEAFRKPNPELAMPTDFFVGNLTRPDGSEVTVTIPRTERFETCRKVGSTERDLGHLPSHVLFYLLSPDKT